MFFGSNISAYMRSEPRATLTKDSNNGTITNPSGGHPRSDDAGNWTGCSIGVGNLVGTYKDVSACLLSDYLGRPATLDDLLSLTTPEVKKIYKGIWDSMSMSRVPNQKVANLIFHIKLHFGNIAVVQRALNDLGENLTEDGVMGAATMSALRRKTFWNTGKTFNAIRDRLEQSYQASNPVYTKGFLSILDDFPRKWEIPTWVYVAIILLIATIVALIILL